MKKIILFIIINSFCFSGIKLGFDFSKEMEVDGYNFDIDESAVIGLDINEKDSKIGFGFEYVIKADIENTTSEIGIFSMYGTYKFYEDEEKKMQAFAKFGYSHPFIDFGVDDDGVKVSGGLMFGAHFNFDKIQFSFSIHNGSWEYDYPSYYYGMDDTDVSLTRLTIFYLFF